MPVGKRKNICYTIALPILGMRCDWKNVKRSRDGSVDLTPAIRLILHRHHAVGGCVQVMRDGALAECYAAGNAVLNPRTLVTAETVFRTASIAKMACALLVMRLQTQGRLDVMEDISAFWHEPIRNPRYPEVPIPLAALLNHTSGIVDSPQYYRSYEKVVATDIILRDPNTFANRPPLARFQYSNFAAGLIGCLLENRFGESLETLMQRELFKPLGMSATFDLSTMRGKSVANSYRVLPPSRTPDFNAVNRFSSASPLNQPDPQAHYLLASGSLFLTATALAQLCLPLMNGGRVNGMAFINAATLVAMTTPTTVWPEPEVRMRHGMGLLEIDDRRIHSQRLLGHQGFAYGAVNGVFWDAKGNGFVSLNSGASERRIGHLSSLNRDLISLCIAGDRHA